MAASYTPLEEKSLSSIGLSNPSFKSEADSSFLPTTTFLYTLCFIAIVTAAFYRLIVVGALRLQASEETLRRSNDIFKKVVYGLLGSFSLFILLATLNSQFISGEIGLSVLKTSGSGGINTTNKENASTAPTKEETGNKPVDMGYAARKASHEKAVSRLSPSGITTNYNNAPCTEAQFKETKPSCTSLAYLPEETIQMLLALNSACKCTVVITGGTEPGHKTHGENKRAIDLRLGGPRGDKNNTDPLYVYLKNISGTKLGENKNCFEQYTWKSFTFCDEKPPNAQHLHVF